MEERPIPHLFRRCRQQPRANKNRKPSHLRECAKRWVAVRYASARLRIEIVLGIHRGVKCLSQHGRTSGKCCSDILTESNPEIAHDGGVYDLLRNTSRHAV